MGSTTSRNKLNPLSMGVLRKVRVGERSRRRLLNDLPIEVLSSIFAAFAEDYWTDPKSHSLQTDKGPWLIAKVCQEWRSMIMANPHLWSTIRLMYWEQSIYIPPPNGIFRHSEEIISLQLALSRNNPLLIRFRKEGMTDLYTPPQHHQLVALLFAHQHRWKTFEMIDASGAMYLALHMMSHAMPVDCPLLERVVFGLTPDISPEFHRLRFLAHRDGFPSLKSIKLFGNYFSSQQSVPWPQLETLELEYIETSEADDLIPALGNLTNLRSLSINYWSVEEDCSPLHIPSLLPSLETLRVRVFSRVATVLFNNITAPALKVLDLDHTGVSQSELPSLLALISRSRCSLTRFGCALSDNFGPFIPLIDNMADLTHLSLNTGHNYGELTEVLARRTGDGSFLYCPRLSNLRIFLTVPEKRAGALSSIFTVLDARLQCTGQRPTGLQHRLQEVGLEYSLRGWEVPDGIRRRIRGLRKKGVKIVFEYRKDYDM